MTHTGIHCPFKSHRVLSDRPRNHRQPSFPSPSPPGPKLQPYLRCVSLSRNSPTSDALHAVETGGVGVCLTHPCSPAYTSHLAKLASTAGWAPSLLDLLASISIWLLLHYTTGRCFSLAPSPQFSITFQVEHSSSGGMSPLFLNQAGSHPPGNKILSHPCSSTMGWRAGLSIWVCIPDPPVH